MNILLANSTCKVGGVSTFLLSLRAELLSRGHRVWLFFFDRGPMEPHLPSADVQFGTLADLLRLVAREQIDVVHANNVDWPTGISAVRRLGARLVVTAHKVREPAWTYGWTANNCDVFVTVADWIREELQPFTDAPIQVIPNGIDTGRFHPGAAPSSARPIVAWVGRGSAPRKRLATFAAMAPALASAGLRLWVVDPQGSDSLASTHPDAADALASVAEMWRGIPYEDMADVYREVAASGGCVISTASMEGLPLALLEAQACGCPVIAADVRGVRECVSPVHGGLLHPEGLAPGDVAGLVVEALRDPAVVQERQHAAARYVRTEFSLERMATRYLTAYREPRRAPHPHQRNPAWRHSPLRHWSGYLEERLGVGYAQYDAARTLSASGDHWVATAAADAAFVTAPTMYAHPQRLAYWVRQHLAARRRAGQRGQPNRLYRSM